MHTNPLASEKLLALGHRRFDWVFRTAAGYNVYVVVHLQRINSDFAKKVYS